MFRTVVLALCLASSAAFVPSTVQSARATTEVSETKADLVAASEARNGAFLGKSTGFWDPLARGPVVLGPGEEATVGYLRHAEIKHGRVAMAAFVGYCAQSSDLLKGVHTALPVPRVRARRRRRALARTPAARPRRATANLTPALRPLSRLLLSPSPRARARSATSRGSRRRRSGTRSRRGKVQILVLIGALESYGEMYTPHYTKGRQAGLLPAHPGQAPRVYLRPV